jgi:hypothetical protein
MELGISGHRPDAGSKIPTKDVASGKREGLTNSDPF